MSRSEDTGNPLKLKMSNCDDKMGVFINLTDEVVQRVLALPDPQHEDITKVSNF